MKMTQDEIRKGPWTEQEDIVLINFVHLFGDRRWDFIAKVSGLNRTGKSCRLRWVNYLHPGLKRGKMTPQEEKLVLELHEKWGNRWSRIARKLPGRTDNEIKNYWRTHMRKKAQENKRAISPSTQERKRAISPSSSSSASLSNMTTVNSSTFPETGEASFYDTGGPARLVVSGDEAKESVQVGENGFSMDDIWKDIENTIEPVCDGFSEEVSHFPCPSMVSPPWEYGPDMLWRMDEEESKVFLPYEHATMLLIG